MKPLRGNDAYESLLGSAQCVVINDLPDKEYHALRAFSASGAKHLLRSAAHFKAAQDAPIEPTPAMVLGTAIHMAVLEPARFADKVWVSEKETGREKADVKAAREEREATMRLLGNLVLTKDQHQHALAVQAAVWSHPTIAPLLIPDDMTSRSEVTILWRDPQFGIPCKARIDKLRDDAIVIDLKSTQDASPEAFARTCATFGYHVQGAVYNIAHEVALNRSLAAFVFVAVETSPPYGLKAYRMQTNALLRGTTLAQRAMATYRDALTTNDWPGYDPMIEDLPFPQWALKEPT